MTGFLKMFLSDDKIDDFFSPQIIKSLSDNLLSLIR